MQQRVLMFLMLLSGFAGISYEILYGRILGNVIGDQFAVSAAVLITFLLGIGLGSRFAWRLWPYLWLIELMIGLYGAGFAFASEGLETLLYASLPLMPQGLAASLGFCVVLLLLPSFLIGCSVPLFAGYLQRLSPASSFSRAYALYNMGAALTALLIEYCFLRWFGLQGAVLCFASINVLVAILLRWRFVLPSIAGSLSDMVWDRNLYALLCLSVASAVFQLLLLKLSEMILGPFRESFALVLSLILLGIALGSWLVHRFSLRLQAVALYALLGLLLLFVSFEPLVYGYAQAYQQAATSVVLLIALKWFFLAAAMILPVLAFGATIPALLQQGDASISRDSGYLLFIACLANVFGFLLMVFVLHPLMDYGQILLVIIALTIAALWFLSTQLIWVLSVSVFLCLVSGLAYWQLWDEDLLYVSYTNIHDKDDLRNARADLSMPDKYKGYQDVFAINWMHGRPYFFINGYNSIPLNSPSEKVVGALSSFYAAKHQQAMVLGLGSGATASVVGHVFAHTDVVEINPVVRDNLYRMQRWNYAIEANPKVNLIVDDAIHYSKSVHKTYDLILNTVTTPLYFSSSKLYTQDFFTTMKQRLNADGVYVTWMDARIGDKGAGIILKTLHTRFKHCALLYIKSSYFLLIASDQPLQSHALDLFKQGDVVYDDLLLRYGIDAQLLPYQLLAADVFRLSLEQDLPLNTSNRPELEFEMARLAKRGIPVFKKQLLKAMGLAHVQQAFVGDDDVAAKLLWQSVLRVRSSSFSRHWRALLAQEEGFTASYQRVQRRYYQHQIALGVGASALHQQAYRLMRSKHYEEAILGFTQVLELDPKHNNTHFNRAACYEYLAAFDQAYQEYLAELRVDPDDEDVAYRLARVLVKQQAYQQAVAAFQALIRMQGDAVKPRVYHWLAKAYEGLSAFDLAIQARKREQALR